MPFQIQAKFQAVRMETLGPLERGAPFQFKIVPFNTDAKLVQIPIKPLPTILCGLPDDCLIQ
jgi:hypothetical protein